MDNFNNRYIPVRERIFSLLKSKSIQQRDFAELIGVHPVTVTNWKKGKSYSFIKNLSSIAAALGTTEVWLLTGKNTAQNPDTIQEMQSIADSANIHLLDLLGIGKQLDQYVFDVEGVRDSGGELPPGSAEGLKTVFTSDARALFNMVDPDGKEKFFGILETDSLCQKIARLCERKGIEPSAACKACGIGESFLQDISKGNAPSVIKIQALAQYLGVTTSELLGEKAPASAAGSGDYTPKKEDLMAAFWGGDKDLSPEDMAAMWQDVETFAAFVAQKKKEEKRQ